MKWQQILTKRENKVHYTNWNGTLGVHLGDVVQSEDGYYYWWAREDLRGAESAYVLRAIADMLDELNKEWDDIIQNDPIFNA